MYFTNTPALNSMEAIMKKLPYGTQKGGGRFRRLYQYTKKDCDCRLCLYYRKKNGCALTHCPMLDIRLGCGAATIGDAVLFSKIPTIQHSKNACHKYTTERMMQK